LHWGLPDSLLAGCFVVDWEAGCLAGGCWLAGCLAGCLAGWLAGWPQLSCHMARQILTNLAGVVLAGVVFRCFSLFFFQGKLTI